ncbi:MAG: hypothetical protein K6G61_12740 [Solobacterium sp.]|nr:hypothetical protein [Solobacterium sp.]
MHEKNILGDIRGSYIADGMIVICLLFVNLLIEMIIAADMPGYFLVRNLVLIGLYIGFKGWLAYGAVKQIRNRIAYLKRFGISLDEERFMRLTDEIMIGSEWLIWSQDREYRLWHKRVLSYVKEAETDHPGASQGIMELYCSDHPGIEAFIFTKNGDVPGILNEWLKA